MSRFARAYVAASAVLVALAATTATDLRWDALPWAGSCLLGAGAVIAGMRVHRPRNRGFWFALAAADGAWGLAAVAQLAGAGDVSSSLFGGASLMYLPGYAGLGAATVIVLRQGDGARRAVLDAGIGVVVAAAAVWPLTVHLLHVEGRAAAFAGSVYPAWDLSLTLLLLRIVASRWFRLRSLQLLTLAMVGATFTDAAYSSVLFESPLAQRLMSVAYTCIYLLLGAAALPRSMRRLPPSRVRDLRGASRRTLPVLTVALAVAPLTFGVEEALSGDLNGVALAGLALAAVVLVVARVGTLIGHLNELRARAEESERLFRLVFDSAGIGISVGAEGVLSRTNPALQRMLGYSAGELAAKHFSELTHPDDRELITTPRAGKAYSFEKRYLRKDGQTLWAEVTLTAPPDDSFGIAVIDDVTVAKQLEDDLRHAQKMEAVGQLAGGIAHDFNNLMTAVIGHASMLQRELPAGGAQAGRADAIGAAAQRAAELTRKLLAFSRRQVMRVEPVDLAVVVRELEPILRPLLPENVVADYVVEPGTVAKVDRAELEQVLLNLCLNARDAMPGGGLLSIYVRSRGDSVELSVADTGIGMSDDTRQRIFDPFFTTKPVGQGTGLGLSTVDGIVGQLGGSIDVVSEPGRGSTFTVRLPRVAEPVVEAAATPAAAVPASDGVVLLVEDEEIVRHVTTEMLRSSGYDVVAAANAEDALALLAGGAVPDVLVSDVVMTGIDGPTLVEHARELAPALPVLFVSGYPAETFGDRTAERILTKPFTPAELAEQIERVRRTPVAV